jgi:hypothetical protein
MRGYSDLVASMLARSLPQAGTDSHRKEVVKIFAAVANNVPGILHEMQVGRASEKLARKQYGIPSDMHTLRADGPILNHHILTFAAKLGFALHFEMTGSAIPTTGGVQAMWFSNLQGWRNSGGDFRDAARSVDVTTRVQERWRPIQVFMRRGRAGSHVVLRHIQ